MIVNFGPDILRIFSYTNWMIARCITDISHNVSGVCTCVCCASNIAGNCQTVDSVFRFL